MAEYDLVIRNTTIATASDVVKGDIGIAGGRVVALGEAGLDYFYEHGSREAQERGFRDQGLLAAFVTEHGI